ncbi:hypothetical protein BD410DRAFT_795156 [Rickenella mellea]|uniref:Uncharacterized protein n=1 Tax=Rickenella mellea TaxID=50990 RepID=A0A4Y7PNI4_9AGAM|nr:hypothetical protein BD410DRAFT_795156 [Rickenella mellea]
MDLDNQVYYHSIKASAIHTFAPELLAKIFLHCLDDEYRHSTRCVSQAPLLLGRVCRTWRTVSVSSPDLWSRIVMVDSELSKIDCKKDLVATELWLSRSGSRPLSICIDYDGKRGSEAFPQLLRLLASQSSRWAEVKMTIPPKFDNIMLAPFQTGQVPQLECFDITEIQLADVVYSFALSSAPRLQEFRYYNDFGGGHIDFGGQTHRIKKIDIVFEMGIDSDSEMEMLGLSLGDLLTCLTNCPLLEQLNIPFTKPWTNPAQETPTIIELSHLRGLALNLSPGIDPGFLFDILFLPALKFLTIYMEHSGNRYTDWPHLRSMLKRSRPPLQHLRVAVPMTEATLIESLSYIPSLTFLSYGRVDCTDSILDSLALGKSDSTKNLCPSLQTIDFGLNFYGDNMPFSPNAMIAMILSRRQHAESTSGKVLEAVRGGAFKFDSVSSNPDIAKCVDKGLKLGYGHQGRRHPIDLP